MRAPAPSAKSRAIRLLARREHGARELTRKLAARGVDADAAAQAVAELADVGLQSDQRYVDSIVRVRIDQGHGPLRIRAELQQAGVADELIRSALDAADVDWREQSIGARARRFGDDGPCPASDWQKQYRFLQGRGFTSDQIRAALKSGPPGEDA